jgi:hypothetical protein
MPRYCRAYRIGELRKFPGWTDSTELADEVFVYLWDDLTVMRDPIQLAERTLWDAVTPQWEEFCTTELRFALPKDLVHANG